MLLIRNFLQHSRLLKIAFFMLCSIFFTNSNANLSHVSYQTNRPNSDSFYFLDIDDLQPQPLNTLADLIYVEKNDNSAEWVVVPIKSSMHDYYKTVAAVVATEIHKRIDEQALVPLTKFLIKKNTNNHNWELLGSVYKKISYSPISEIMSKNYFVNYSDVFYNKHNLRKVK